MGMISDMLALIFGSNRNVLRETVEVFQENAEAGADRAHTSQMAALSQMQAEFRPVARGWFDKVMDGVNRLPRPALAFATLGLMGSAMIDPIWFASRMQGIALVPEPLWWLLGVIVSFYFGARQQAKTQGLQRDLAQSLALVPQVTSNIAALNELRAEIVGVAGTKGDANDEIDVVRPEANPALQRWREQRTKL